MSKKPHTPRVGRPPEWRKALKIIDYCICELHDEIFDIEEEDDE